MSGERPSKHVKGKGETWGPRKGPEGMEPPGGILHARGR
jgi:hypothetical protein